MIAGDVPFYAKIWPKLTHFLANADFKSIFARSVSAVTSSKKQKSSINTNRKSTMSFPMSVRLTVYVAPEPS